MTAVACLDFRGSDGIRQLARAGSEGLDDLNRRALDSQEWLHVGLNLSHGERFVNNV